MRYFVKKEAQFGAQKRCAVRRALRVPMRRAMCSIVVRGTRMGRDARHQARIVRSAARTHRQTRIFRM
jgi:hypothetical protein